MKALLQRVKKASVTIENKTYSSINQGILVLLGIEKNDNEEQAKILANKICKLRIFEDDTDKMNLSVKDIEGEILVVSQFTLAGSCKKGTRPSFDNAESPSKANDIYQKFTKHIQENGVPTKNGEFGAMMDVELINDGPVTFLLEK